MEQCSDVALARQVIPVTCPVTRLRIAQACRGRACTHPAAFCATALPSIRMRAPAEAYRCPLCDAAIEPGDVCVDGPLTAFLSQYLEVKAISVRQRSNGTWLYQKAPANRNRAQPAAGTAAADAKRQLTQAQPAAGTADAEHSCDAEPSSSEERPHWAALGAAAATVAGWQRPQRPQSWAAAPRPALVPPAVQRSLGLAAPAGGARRTATARDALEAAPPRNQREAGARQRDDERGASVRGNAGLPARLSAACKSERRLERKARTARGALLEAAHKELIKRALWEDHPESRGESLW